MNSPSVIPLREKYRRTPSNGKFKAHYDHQPGVRFKDEQGKLHIVPDKRKTRTRASGTAISDLRR